MPAPTDKTSAPVPARSLAQVFHWRRLRFTLLLCIPLGVLMSYPWTSGFPGAIILGLVAMTVFGILEQWPARLPLWCARWTLQVGFIALAMPFTVWAVYVFFTPPGAPYFWFDPVRRNGFVSLCLLAMLLAPWIAMSVLVRQKDALARDQALRLELAQAEFERVALDARMRLLQAQIEPHFLFNTLANVRKLVDSASPQASPVLGHLIAYLRAAMPRLQGPWSTLGEELDLVRAYLELMHMRMPDRLQFAIDAGEAVLPLRCPPSTLLTLVENAVRHGIDPAEEGGRIDIRIALREGCCHITVADTGVGMAAAHSSGGTGLAALRERLQLAFGAQAQLQLAPNSPCGVQAQISFPAEQDAP